MEKKEIMGNMLGFKQNFMWLTGGLAGMLAAEKWVVPWADLSPAILVGILIGANIGAYMRNSSEVGREYDERQRENMEESMAWGFMTSVTMLGLNLFDKVSFTSPEIIIRSSAVALLATIVLEVKQTGFKGLI